MLHRKIKLQSAMEYLMTYGWAILIIAVVLGALFQLGVFNSTNFAPKASPGSCRVLRIAGTVNLEGVCSGLLPQYVGSFNGQNSYVDTGTSTILNFVSGDFTIALWIKTTFGSSQTLVQRGQSQVEGYTLMADPYVHLLTHQAGSYTYCRSQHPANSGSWEYWSAVRQGTNIRLYRNGIEDVPYTGGSCTAISNPVSSTHSLQIGYGSWGYLSGSVANVQIYNISLSANDIQALYIKGIGGAPISPQYLVGWWPLNGDANDYGGTNNNGVPNNAVYTSAWIGGYTPP